MKPIIRHSFTGLVLAVALAVFSGCASKPGGGGKINWKDFEPMVEVAAYTGAKIYLIEHPDQRPVFEHTVSVLDALVADPEINAAKLSMALQELPIKELQDPKAAIVIGSTLVLWNAYKDRLPIGEEGSAVLRPIGVRLRNGLGAALGMPPIVAPGPDLQARLALPDTQLMQLKRKP